MLPHGPLGARLPLIQLSPELVNPVKRLLEHAPGGERFGAAAGFSEPLPQGGGEPLPPFVQRGGNGLHGRHDMLGRFAGREEPGDRRPDRPASHRFRAPRPRRPESAKRRLHG